MTTSEPVSRGFRLLGLFFLLFASPTMAQDCRAIQAACVASCLGGSGATGDLSQVMRVVPERVKACITRCAIAPCEQTPLTSRVCDETSQSICNNGFQACGDACLPSTAANAAEVQSQVDFLLQPIKGMFGAAPMRPTHHRRHQLRVYFKVMDTAGVLTVSTY